MKRKVTRSTGNHSDHGSILPFYAFFGIGCQRSQINRDVTAALEQLYASNPTAKVIGEKAVAVLVFPQYHQRGLYSRRTVWG